MALNGRNMDYGKTGLHYRETGKTTHITNNLKVLITDKEGLIASAKEILEDALKENFEGVLVLGIKDGNIYRTTSKQKSVIQVVGLIELLKTKLLEDW